MCRISGGNGVEPQRHEGNPSEPSNLDYWEGWLFSFGHNNDHT